MILVILFIVSILISLGVAIWTGYDNDDWGIGTLAGFLTGAICLIFLIIFPVIIAESNTSSETAITQQYNIETLQDTQGISGKYSSGFLYGSGYVKSGLAYYVGVNYPEGFKVNTYEADKCYITFSDMEKPRIESYNYTYSEQMQKLWGFDKISNDFAYYKIYLPSDAIKLDMNYQIDMK